jgi:hypothetical protein
MITQKNFWFFFGGVWLGIGVLFLVIGGGILWHEWSLGERIARDGATVQGVVLAKSMKTRKNQEPTFRVEYRYAAGSAVNEATAEVDDKTWGSLTEGGAIAVTYVRGDPAAHRLAGQPSAAKGFLISMFMGIGGLLAISGAVIVWALARRRAGKD